MSDWVSSQEATELPLAECHSPETEAVFRPASEGDACRFNTNFRNNRSHSGCQHTGCTGQLMVGMQIVVSLMNMTVRITTLWPDLYIFIIVLLLFITQESL